MNFPEDQSREACLAAVQQNGWALQCVKEQTEEIIQVAVSRNTYAINFIRNPTTGANYELLHL